METITLPLHDYNYGIVWEEWYDTGERRRIVRKELGFYALKPWQGYLLRIAAGENFHQFISGWTPTEELNPSSLREIAGV